MATKMAEAKTEAGSKKRAMTALRVFVSLALIAWVVAQIDLQDTVQRIAGADLRLLAAALGLNFVGSALTATRWGLLLRSQGAATKTRYLIGKWMEACFFNQFLPSTIGGDSKRIYDSYKLGASKSGAVAAVGVDRLLGLLALICFGLLAFWISALRISDEGTEIVWLGAGAVLLLGIIVFVFHPPKLIVDALKSVASRGGGFVGRFAEKVDRAFQPYRGKSGILAAGFFWSCLLQFNVICFYALIGIAVGLDLEFLTYMQVIPVASVVLLLPVTINGIGLRESIFALLLAGFAVGVDAAVAFAWTSFLVFSLFGLLGGLVYAFSSERARSGEQSIG